MHKVIADKNGGRKVPLTEAEIAQVIKDRDEHLQRQRDEEALKLAEAQERQVALDALTASLAPEHADMIKKILTK